MIITTVILKKKNYSIGDTTLNILIKPRIIICFTHRMTKFQLREASLSVEVSTVAYLSNRCTSMIEVRTNSHFT